MVIGILAVTLGMVLMALYLISFVGDRSAEDLIQPFSFGDVVVIAIISAGFLIAVALAATGIAWFADRPGDVVLTWMGYRVETSLMVAALAVLVFAIVLMLAWSILRGIVRTPEQVSLFFRHRRAMKGYLAISRGLIAIGSGDLRSARRAADEAARLSPRDPLTLLLAAQSAQMAGDRGGAEYVRVAAQPAHAYASGQSVVFS